MEVIYKKNSANFCDFWRLPANNYMMTDNKHNELIFLQLIRDNKGILYKICHLYCRNAGDREDLMQEMICQLWRSGEKFDANYKFSTWMYRVALNVAISFYRKETRSGFRIAPGGDVHLVELEDPSPGNGDLEEKIDLLQVFISELGELDKALMILYLEERPYREIAEILGISETNVATKLSRIKGRLKQQFLKANRLFL
jgi:RNA polymerase sigma factor (sigma-70 family)